MRKRSATAIGLCFAVLGSDASPYRQHYVPPADRSVKYRHVIEQREKQAHSKFWIPSASYAADVQTESRDASRSRRSLEEWPHVWVDAAIEDADEVFRALRRLEQVRRTVEEEPGFVNSNATLDVGEVNETQVLNVTGPDYNVTAGTEYNVSDAFNDTSTVVYTESERTSNATDDNKHFRPIRIRAYLSEVEGGGQFLTEEQHDMLLQDIVRPALLSWSAALRVDPVVGNLTVDPKQLPDGQTCGPGKDSGLPSAPVPESHLQVGVPNTDLILYLHLGFVQNLSAPDWYHNTAENATLAALLEALDSAKNLTLALNETKTNATRYHSSNWTRPICSGDYLAASSFCSTDQYDRPTAAILHICIGDAFFDRSSLRVNIMTMMHEMAHALGFNSLSLAHFRRPDGTPITPRNNKGEIPLTEIACAGPHTALAKAKVALPSEEILQFRTVRGGVRVAEVVTPSVRQVVRNHFNCQNLPGAELESGEFLPLTTDPIETSCIGDHWERRLFKSDLLNPVIDDLEFNPRLSTINLAYFADSGWYQVDLSRSSLAVGWGRGAGCAFVEETCIDAEGNVPPSYESFFCNDSTELDRDGFAIQVNGCTADLSKKASCSIGLYDGELPNEYQYFNFTNLGGSDPFMDYCPVFSGFTNGLCTDRENEAVIRVDRMERFGERNSRCIAGRLAKKKTALCLRIACAVEDRSFHVQVDGIWRRCNSSGEVLLAKNGDEVICPDPIRICPTFYCDRDCLGTSRICDYGQGKCVCEGSCLEDDDEPSSFYDPSAQNNSLPDADSPLSDYYVPTARMLHDERDPLLDDWAIAVVAVAAAVIVAALMYFWYRRKGAGQSMSPRDDTDNAGGSINPNKDKMLATVVVDIRMNRPFPEDVLDRASETDLSMTDTEGAGTHVSHLDILESTIVDLGDDDEQADNEYIDPLAPEFQEEYIDPLAPPLRPTTIMRRRNKLEVR